VGDSAVRARLCAGQATPQRRLVHEVDERALPVDLDHRQPLAVTRLELGVTGDVDLGELEVRICRDGDERLARALAEVAARRVVEDDLRRYGYRPLVVVASATRMTASPYAAMRMLVFRRARMSQVSWKAFLTMSWRFEFTSSSFQKYSWSP
jgi:hypothetical protein